MFKMKGLFCLSLAFTVIASAGISFAQETSKRSGETPVMWEPVDIKSRDLYLGPGGAQMKPDLKGAVLVGRQPGGNNLKFRIKDRDGDEWVAKIADESQPEIAAVRLLWGIGYKTEVDYLSPRINLGKEGIYKNVRLEARPKNIKRGERWMWANNPFVGTKEFDGLKIMMAMFNNWDLKDENNVILTTKDGVHYIVSDLGSSFGKLAKESQSRSGRSVNDPEGYAKSTFINAVHDGQIEFAYTGRADHLIKGISVENARWVVDLLKQLTDKQINDAFRAANYKPEEAAIFASAFKARIAALDGVVGNATAIK